MLNGVKKNNQSGTLSSRSNVSFVYVHTMDKSIEAFRRKEVILKSKVQIN